MFTLNQFQIKYSYSFSIFSNTYSKGFNKKLISRLYVAIQTCKADSTSYIKHKGEKESGIQLTEEDWLEICESQATTANSRSLREFNWKNLVHFFIKPKLTALQTGWRHEGRCWRQCGTSLANHFHTFSACPKIVPYLQGVRTHIHQILGVELDNSFVTLYLGKIPHTVPEKDRYLLKIQSIGWG